MSARRAKAISALDDAVQWAADASRQLQLRGDRVDALDSIRFSRQALDKAEASIRASAPEFLARAKDR